MKFSGKMLFLYVMLKFTDREKCNVMLKFTNRASPPLAPPAV